LLLVCLCSLPFLGCKKTAPTGTVQGTVLFNGTPYSNAAVVFLSMQTGQGGSVDIGTDGKFQLKAPLPVGTYKVYLAPKVGEPTDQPKPVSIDATVPEKYWNEASTDVSIEVKAGPNDVKVEFRKP
jgi:hypothetical protein